VMSMSQLNTTTWINKPHKCKSCVARFKTKTELGIHVRYMHTHEKPNKCPDCDYMCVEAGKLKRHMKCHTGERPYQCPHCTYASPDSFGLNRHMRTHTGEKPYECEFCHSRFAQKNTLTVHKKVHTAGTVAGFQCEHCPVTCKRKADLRIHVQKLHISDKPMHCTTCEKSFPDRYTMLVHKKSHKGQSFICDLCQYSSNQKSHLDSHMLIHTDQKPFQCDQCDQGFRWKHKLKKHRDVYHNPFYLPPANKKEDHKCPQCDRTFRLLENLRRHLVLHDPESSSQQKLVALNIGKHRKIQIIDGQKVEVSTGEDTEEENDPDMETLMMQGEDGRQYVYLEVIQLPDDGNGGGHGVVRIAGGEQDYGFKMHTQPSKVKVEDEQQHIETAMLQKQNISKDIIRMKKEQDIANCFGFDDDSDSEDCGTLEEHPFHIKAENQN